MSKSTCRHLSPFTLDFDCWKFNVSSCHSPSVAHFGLVLQESFLKMQRHFARNKKLVSHCDPLQIQLTSPFYQQARSVPGEPQGPKHDCRVLPRGGGGKQQSPCPEHHGNILLRHGFLGSFTASSRLYDARSRRTSSLAKWTSTCRHQRSSRPRTDSITFPKVL